MLQKSEKLDGSIENTEKFENFISNIKSISTLLSNWSATEGEMDDVTLFLILLIEARINEFVKGYLETLP